MDSLTENFYCELRLLARSFMRRERWNHTLSPTDLCHEAYSRVCPRLSTGVAPIHDMRASFAIAMRRVLIEHARKRIRRNNLLPRDYLDVGHCANPTRFDPDRLELDRLAMMEEALEEFSKKYPIHAKIVEHKIYARLSIEKIAQLMGISDATVQRRWDFAKANLMRDILKRDQG